MVDLQAIGRTGPGHKLTHQAESTIDFGLGGPASTLPPIDLSTDPRVSPPTWIGDLDGSGCLDVLLPGTTFRHCPGDTRSWEPRSGPAWTLTTPLIAYDSAGGRRLLVAGGLGWSSGSGWLAVPAPLAATMATQGWRGAPSSPFALEEIDASDIGYFEVYPSPIMDIDPNVSDREGPGMILGGTGGDRVFIRLAPTGPVAGDPAVAPRPNPPSTRGRRPTTCCRRPLRATAGLHTCRWRPIARPAPIAARSGSPCPSPAIRQPTCHPASSGRPDDPGAEPTLAAAWQVEALGVNGYGEVSELSVGRVALDQTGPNVLVDAPFVSAPWPFMAPIRGMAEPGARVRLGGRTVRRRGRERRLRAPGPAGAVAPGPAHRSHRRSRQRLEPDAQRRRRGGLPAAALAGPGDHRHPARGRDHDLARDRPRSAGARRDPPLPAPTRRGPAVSPTLRRTARTGAPGRRRPSRRRVRSRISRRAQRGATSRRSAPVATDGTVPTDPAGHDQRSRARRLASRSRLMVSSAPAVVAGGGDGGSARVAGRGVA